MRRRRTLGGSAFARTPARRSRTPGHALLFVLATLGCGAAHADSPGALKQLSLEQLADLEVTSVAKRPVKLSATASAIQVITAEEIRRSGATSIPEALRLADNLDVAQVNAHDWAISARGFNTSLANKLLVLIDGRTVYTPLFSGVFWERQDYLLADIDRIEVISGPGGTLWGANAVNGVINIITKSASETRGTYMEAGAGNQLEDAGAIRYGASVGADAAFRVYGKYFDRDDEPRANGGSNRDAWHNAQAGFRFDAASSTNDSWTVQGDYYSGDEGIATGGAARINGGNLLGHWTHTLSADSATSLQVYYDRTHLADPIPAAFINSILLAPAGVLVDDLDTWDVDFDHSLRLGERSRLIWGLGWRHTRDEVSNAPALAFLPTRLDQDLYSGFVQGEWTLDHGVGVTVGTKLEHNDYTGFEVQPNARVQWDFAPDHLLWAAVSRAVRMPSRVDRDVFQPGPDAPLVVLEGSADFISETVRAHELGYRAQFGDEVTASVSAFYNVYEHVRSTGITPGTILPLVFRNDLEGDTYGIEFSANWQLRDWWRLHGGLVVLEENIRIRPGGSDINAGINETADPDHWATLRSSMDLPHAVQLDAGLRRIGRRELNSGPVAGPVPGYTEMDVRIGWHASANVELSLVGQNLLHARHPEYGFPSPDRPEIARSVFGKLVWRF